MLKRIKNRIQNTDKKKIYEFVRFCIVGTIATGIHYGVYRLFLQWQSDTISYSIAYGASFICNFLLTSFFTFKKKPTTNKAIGFTLSHIFNLTIQILLLKLFVFLGIPAKYAPFCIYPIIIPINFLMIRFVFYFSRPTKTA